MPDPNRIIIFDTTLRDGEQSPGCSMNLEEKLRMAQLLDEMGVDVIEAGFPIASKGDFEAVEAISRTIKNATVAGLCRAIKKDIEASAQAISAAPHQRIHTFISTSPLHMKYKLQMSPEAVLDAVAESVSFARNFTDDVEWSAEDGSRTEDDFLCRCVEAAISAGATTINIPDTVGYAMPDDYAAKFTMLRHRVPNIDHAILSVHCHNDLGLAVANSLAGVAAGARQIECTINGIGERAGNAALEEIVMAMRTRPDTMPYKNNINTQMITKMSRTLSSITGFVVQPNKAIVGANAFAHESGIHQDGVLKHAQTYEIMTPESVGLTRSNLVMGKHSGRHAFKSKLDDMGYTLGENAFEDAFNRFKDLADKKKNVFDEDIIALVEDETGRDNENIRFVSLVIQAGTKGPQIASIELDVEGERKFAMSEGNGPVDAIFKAIRMIIPHDDAVLLLYQVHAVTGGTDAQAEVSVKIEENGKTVVGQGTDADTLVASARAYIHAVNKLIDKRERTAPPEAVMNKSERAGP
ncbi:MAG: 2-isopropylmalate synthase [Alphaproteobacteria bacterium]|jgi:2-isopropylmalate synthase|nr:2-isopropylmalate synthase [Alphaproteobacteria bacterium]MCB1550656.1 2-isopropylmalate synthase [Alphaproteobacteria bacterium]MCB9985730.1 2-isopropylmalate synthase [Micavibrio sp.]HPQ50412.1 2-isopropylmalate synthase [Alphaproteobacteria bacterium]